MTQRHIFLAPVLAALCCLAALPGRAVQAWPWPVIVTQPDGTAVTLQGHGDEWHNWVTTAEGHTVARDCLGFWRYIGDESGAMTERVARDRLTDDDRRWLDGIAPGIVPPRAAAAPPNRLFYRPGVRQQDFRGLIILVNYSDRKFSVDDPARLFDDMVNTPGYKGFTGTDGRFNAYEGSVRDYFSDNSMGQFDPHFDVVGPVEVDYTQTYVNQWEHAVELFQAALTAADGLLDYADYDTNGDGLVDMVYFIVAGGGSHVAGNERAYLWPHMSQELGDIVLDGKRFAPYACSTELYGSERAGQIDGIGTICHEFGHALGLPDLYDVDGSTGGTSDAPGYWDIMASGSYLNESRTPAGYSLYERYALGWARPEVLTAAGELTLLPLQHANAGYRIDSDIEHEYFLLENRQPTGWDSYLPGHGMLVWRVDSTDVDAWEYDRVNNLAAHNLCEIVRAGTSTPAAAAFPGPFGVDSLVNRTTAPTITSWYGTPSPLVLRGIAERDTVVTLRVERESARGKFLVEDFEAMPVTEADTTGIEGKFARWAFTDATVCHTEVFGQGQRAVALQSDGEARTLDPIDRPVKTVTFRAYNTGAPRLMRCYFSTDGGKTWKKATNANGMSNLSVAGGINAIELNAKEQTGLLLKFTMTTSASTAPVLIDDIRCLCIEDTLPGDVNGDGVVDIADVNAVINAMLGRAASDGLRVASDVNGDGRIDIADVNAVINAMLF